MKHDLLSRKILNIFPLFAFLLLFPAYLYSSVPQIDISGSENVATTDTIPEATFKSGGIHITSGTTTPKNIYDASVSAQITVENPNSSTTWKVGREETIEWTTSGVYGDVRIWLYRGDGELVRRIYRWSGSGPAPWTVPPYIEPGNDYYMVIFSADDPDVRGRTDGAFTIDEGTGPYITMLSPTGGEKWTSGEEEEIRWTSRNVQGEVEILLHREGAIFIEYISRGTSDDGTYNWTVPDDIEPRTDYYVGVRSLENESVWDTKGLFQIGYANSDLSGIVDTRGEAWDVQVSGNYAYIADEDGGLTIADITNPSNAFEVGSIETPGRALTIDVIGNLAYVADERGGLQVYNISDPANPTEVGSFDTLDDAWGIAVSGDHAYIAVESDGLQIIDISDPENLTEIGRFDTPGNAVNVQVRGDYAYVADYSSGLRILDISDPANPTEVSFLDAQDDVWDVDLKGTYAYVADHGLRIIDISDPANPAEVSNFEASDSAWDVTVSGNYAYIAADNAGIRTIDVSDPANPVETGYFNTPDPAYGVSSAGEYVYVAAEESGVYIIRNQSDEDVTPPTAPSGLSTSVVNGQITLTWDPNSETDLAQYRLYRFALPQQYTEQIATIPAGTETYTDTDIVNGRTYSYWVSAVDINGNESGFSDEVQDSLETFPADQKINFWVHSPVYEFGSIEWVFPEDSEAVPLSNNNGFWGIEEPQFMEACDQNDSSDQNLIIKKNGQRVGILYVNLCDQIESSSAFNAILLLNDKMEIENKESWDYYSSTDEVMVSMLVAPDKFQLNQSIEPSADPILGVHGVSGFYPYWGSNIISEINGEDNYHFWQFYYPYDQPIKKSGILLGEALNYLLSDQLFGLSLSYQTNNLKVLAHSMGGLVSRSHIQSKYFHDTIQKLVMLGTPNHGSYGSFRLTNTFFGGFAGSKFDMDPSAPAYFEMIPGSVFLRSLNNRVPSTLNDEADFSYITVAGIKFGIIGHFFDKIHQEIEFQDDGFVSVSSVSLLKYNIPILVTEHYHTTIKDNPENIYGLTNARGLVLPLLKGEYTSLRQHPNYIGNLGFNDNSDNIKSIETSDFGSVILNTNFSKSDYDVGIRAVYGSDNRLRIYSSANSASFIEDPYKVKGDSIYSSSGSFLINSNSRYDNLGVNFEESSQIIEVGRFTNDLIRPWIKIGFSEVELEFQPLQTNYSGQIALTPDQKDMMKIHIDNPTEKQKGRTGLVQYIDSKVDTALIYIELPGESIDVPDYQIALTSPPGVEYNINNAPANWSVTEDKEQGYAYFYIPKPEPGNWEVDHNPSINNVYVASSITSDIDIISRVQGDNHIVSEPVTIEIEIEGVNQLSSYKIEPEYVCYDDNSEELEAGSLELLNIKAGVYETQLLAPSESIGCTVEPELIADVGNEEITRYAFSSVDLKANNATSIDRDGESDEIPNQSKLHQNYPNPFNPTTNIRFELPESSVVTLEVYNILGQRVAQLANERKSPGHYTVNFDASGLSSGVYLYRLQTDSFTETKQMMLIK
ncbi:Ser-Thr-rich GPI-anchored membrane family protein [Rhodohalobacter sp. 8-1]|uniref:Ser-Thr-rich GPI-anchored membrane family protein n=1 Tax=Rhodohalobacter sp. 8-1 TaxID=3131972 RepID=UPI0030EC6AE9